MTVAYIFKKKIDFLCGISGNNKMVDHIVLNGNVFCYIMQLVYGLKYFTKLITESGFLL